jgi:putative NADH-flavin reductase
MRIAVFGATGATGLEIVNQALNAGHEVTVLARGSATRVPNSPRLHLFVGGLDQQDVVDRVINGQDAVIGTLGTNQKGPVTICTDGVRAILSAMGRHGVRRLVVVSAHGAAESHDHSLYALAVWLSVANKMRDKEGMEALVRASDVDWTIVRPPALSNGPRTDAYRTGTDLKIGITSKISRADLADFLLREAANGRFLRQMPRIAT